MALTSCMSWSRKSEADICDHAAVATSLSTGDDTGSTTDCAMSKRCTCSQAVNASPGVSSREPSRANSWATIWLSDAIPMPCQAVQSMLTEWQPAR